ncbi:phosphotransferase [Streptomyces werraensis]|uniref:phosphotransferase n=1 Tax=Streptomyces werraensis TaxID=68284 RepID=UPI00341AE334
MGWSVGHRRTLAAGCGCGGRCTPLLYSDHRNTGRLRPALPRRRPRRPRRRRPGRLGRAVAAPEWEGPPLWVHGDLHPANVVVSDGTLRA